MHQRPTFDPTERLLLWTLSAVGFFGLNGVFVYSILQPSIVQEALTNPLAVAFVVEALLLVALLAFLLTKWQAMAIPWWWFVALSLIGTILFALPVAVLWRSKSPSEKAQV